MRKVLAQSGGQMPETDDKQRKDDRAAKVAKVAPPLRLQHGHKKGGEKQRDGGEYGALAFPALLAIALEYFINDSIPAGLHGQVSRPLRMRIGRMKDRVSTLRLRGELFVVIGSLLRIHQNSIS